jgi:hypothetical protein
VKQSISNPLQQELARGQHGGPHPDSDLLTALGEGALPQRERQQLLAHLAACADCREVLSIAAAAAMDPADDLRPFVLTSPSRLPRRTWLPWASIAAGLLVVCSAVLFYQQKLALPNNTTVATKEAVQSPSSTLQQTPPSSSLEGKETTDKSKNRPTSRQLQANLRAQSVTAANAIQADKIESAKNSEFSQQSPYQSSAEVGQLATPSAHALKAAQAPSVSAFANVTTERALSAASITASARPHWRINATGQPERSFGDGAWQAVLPQEQSKMRVVSVFDGEVWIGGENSRLYRSTDNGATWNLVALPDKDGRVHSIAHIHFLTAHSGTVESDDGAAWTTLDGGSTWK